MIETPYGPFDGTSWEKQLQFVFKKKFAAEGYQQIPATPGDFGLEGFTTISACGFQCYCPDKAYSSRELHEKQRDKITADLNKLKKYEKQLKGILGQTKLRRWCFVTPKIALNELLAHARSKEADAQSWGLSILDSSFEVILQDADHYASEIRDLQLSIGIAVDFGGLPTSLPELSTDDEVYEQNIRRKTEARLRGRVSADKRDAKFNNLYAQTLREFLDHDREFKNINEQAPPIFARLARLINGYEAEVVEACSTWEGTPQDLTEKLREGLTRRIAKDLAPHLDETGAARIARVMIARWIAVCELDYG